MKIRNHISIRQLAAVAAFATLAAGVLLPACATAQALSDEWTFRGSIYMWMPQITGSAVFAGNTTADIDVKFHTLLDHLKMAGMGNLAAQKGPWGAFTDLIYFDVGNTGTTTRDRMIDGVPVPVTVKLDTGLDFKALVWTLAGSYRVWTDPDWSLDVFAGAQMLRLDATLNYALSESVGPLVGPTQTGSRSASGNTWDGIVGVKGRYGFGANREWFIPYYADVGGGQSQYTWQASAGIGYVFSWGEVVATWRYLDWKEPGDIVPKLTVNGPQLAVVFNW
ncbi:MAG TPA: hypothetical protein VMM27_00085 [Casimicrobiaceae bacterium]|nr:hypothetical protein [Casimicrobiaceae bacterium]